MCGVSHGTLGPSIWVFLSPFGSGSLRVHGGRLNTFLYVCPLEILSNNSKNKESKNGKEREKTKTTKTENLRKHNGGQEMPAYLLLEERMNTGLPKEQIEDVEN